MNLLLGGGRKSGGFHSDLFLQLCHFFADNFRADLFLFNAFVHHALDALTLDIVSHLSWRMGSPSHEGRLLVEHIEVAVEADGKQTDVPTRVERFVHETGVDYFLVLCEVLLAEIAAHEVLRLGSDHWLGILLLLFLLFILFFGHVSELSSTLADP